MKKAFNRSPMKVGLPIAPLRPGIGEAIFLLKEKYLEIEEGRAMQNDRYDA